MFIFAHAMQRQQPHINCTGWIACNTAYSKRKHNFYFGLSYFSSFFLRHIVERAVLMLALFVSNACVSDSFFFLAWWKLQFKCCDSDQQNVLQTFTISLDTFYIEWEWQLTIDGMSLYMIKEGGYVMMSKKTIKYIVLQSICILILRLVKYFDIIRIEDWNASCTWTNRIFRPNSKTSLVVSFGYKFRPHIRLLNVRLRNRAQMTQVWLVSAPKESYGSHIWEQ